MFQGPFIGIFGLRFVVDKLAREPEVGTVVGIFAAVELLAPITARLTADADTLNLLGTSNREVYIQTERQLDLLRENLLNKLGAILNGGIEIGIQIVVNERQTDRRTTIETTLDSRTHRA